MSDNAPRWSFALAFFVLIGLLLYPLFVVDMPPLLDYPIHIARSYIALHRDIDPDLAAIYQIDWRPIPNLASDVVLLLLGQVMDVEVAGRVFLGSCLLLTLAGVVTLHRVNFGRWSWWPLIAALPAYHGALMAGFINFSMGLGLILFGLAAWIGLRERPPALRLCVNTVFALVLFFSHVLCLGLFGIIVGAYELWRLVRTPWAAWRPWDKVRDLALLVTPFLIPAGLYVRHSLTEVAAGVPLFGDWRLMPKIRGLLMPVLTYDPVLDALTILVLVVVPLAFAWYHRLDVARGLVPGIGAVLILFLVLPGHVLGTGFIMDRLPIIVVLVAVAAIQPRALPPRVGVVLAMVVFALVFARTSVLTANWMASGEYYERARTMAQVVQRRSSVLVVSPFSVSDMRKMDLWRHRLQGYPHWHYALINIPNLHSLPVLPLTQRATFSQLHFVAPDKQVLSLQPAYQPYDHGDGGSSTISPSKIFHTTSENGVTVAPLEGPYDYILVLYVGHLPAELQSELRALQPLYDDPEMLLLSVNPPTRSPPDVGMSGASGFTPMTGRYRPTEYEGFLEQRR